MEREINYGVNFKNRGRGRNKVKDEILDRKNLPKAIENIAKISRRIECRVEEK
jgi:hypothetical protein